MSILSWKSKDPWRLRHGTDLLLYFTPGQLHNLSVFQIPHHEDGRRACRQWQEEAERKQQLHLPEQLIYYHPSPHTKNTHHLWVAFVRLPKSNNKHLCFLNMTKSSISPKPNKLHLELWYFNMLPFWTSLTLRSGKYVSVKSTASHW